MVPSLVGAEDADATPPALTLGVAPKAFSPNGDGRQDAVRATIVADEPSFLEVEVRDAAGSRLRTLFSGPVAPGAETGVTWDGTNMAGEGPVRVADGGYEIVARATDSTGNMATRSAPVVVDTVAPAVSWLSVAPDPVVRPRAVRFGLRVWDAGESIRASYTVAGRQGRVGAASAVAMSRGDGALWWRARYRNGVPVPSGLYEVRLSVVDAAGNRAAAPLRRFRVHRAAGTRVYHRVVGAGRMVALTFDDCNSAGAWRRILDVLAARKAKASFFCNGARAARFGSAARRTLREGHTIGSHTWDHALLPRRPGRSVRARVTADQRAWWRFGTTPVPYFRPPYGAYNRTTLRAVGRAGFSRTVMWDVDPRDWTRPGASVIARRVAGAAKPGSIVVLHVQEQTAAALGPLITRLRRRGLRPASLAQMFEAAAR